MTKIYAEVIDGVVSRIVDYPDGCSDPVNPPNVSNAFISVPPDSNVVSGYTYDTKTNTFAPPAVAAVSTMPAPTQPTATQTNTAQSAQTVTNGTEASSVTSTPKAK